MPMIDVRDVAQAHLNSILIKDAANKRFILVNKSIWLHQIGRLLKQHYGKDYPVADRVFPKLLIRAASYFKKELI